MVARLPTPTPSSMGYLLLAAARAARARAARARALRPHLRPLLVGRAVRRATCAAFPRSSTSATWIRRSGSSTRATSRSRCRSATGSKATKLEREEKRLAPRFDLCTATTRAEWETLRELRHRRADGLVSERRRQRILRADRTSRTTPTRSRSSAAWTTTRTRSACSTSARRRCRCCRRKRPALKLADRRRRSVARPCSGSARLPGVTVTGSVPDVRPYLRRAALMVAPLNIARGTQNKILEAMAMGVPVVTSRVAAGGVDASAPEHFLVGVDAGRVRGGDPARRRGPGGAQAAGASPAARECCRITRGSDRCSASTVSSSAASPGRAR